MLRLVFILLTVTAISFNTASAKSWLPDKVLRCVSEGTGRIFPVEIVSGRGIGLQVFDPRGETITLWTNTQVFDPNNRRTPLVGSRPLNLGEHAKTQVYLFILWNDLRFSARTHLQAGVQEAMDGFQETGQCE